MPGGDWAFATTRIEQRSMLACYVQKGVMIF